MTFQIYLAIAVATGMLYTLLFYIPKQLDLDLNKIGLGDAKTSLGQILTGLVGFIISALVLIITIILAPMVWVDVVLGNVKVRGGQN